MSQRTAIGRVGGITPRVTAQRVRAADATQYAANDHIANSTTGSAVTPLQFNVGLAGSGVIAGVRCTAKAASSALVTTAFAFDLMLFRAATSLPYASGSYPADNAALTLTSAAMAQCAGRFSFAAADWVTGGLETGAGWQEVGPASGLPFEAFDLQGVSEPYLLGLLKATAAWNPGNIAQTLDFELVMQGD